MENRVGSVRILGVPEDVKLLSGSHSRPSIRAGDVVPQSMKVPLRGWVREREGEKKQRRRRRRKRGAMVEERKKMEKGAMLTWRRERRVEVLVVVVV